jgi:hypothetical protein
MIGLFEHASDLHAGDEMNHLALCLAAGTYEDVRVILESAGVEVTGRPGDDRCIYFDDPDGHRIQLLTVAEQRQH